MRSPVFDGGNNNASAAIIDFSERVICREREKEVGDGGGEGGKEIA